MRIVDISKMVTLLPTHFALPSDRFLNFLVDVLLPFFCLCDAVDEFTELLVFLPRQVDDALEDAASFGFVRGGGGQRLRLGGERGFR